MVGVICLGGFDSQAFCCGGRNLFWGSSPHQLESQVLASWDTLLHTRLLILSEVITGKNNKFVQLVSGGGKQKQYIQIAIP